MNTRHISGKYICRYHRVGFKYFDELRAHYIKEEICLTMYMKDRKTLRHKTRWRGEKRNM